MFTNPGLILIKLQKQALNAWPNFCIKKYNYSLSNCFDWYDQSRSKVDFCFPNVICVSVREIYRDILEFRIQTRDRRKDPEMGAFRIRRADVLLNIVGGYADWLAIQKRDLTTNTKTLFPEYRQIHSQVLDGVLLRVEKGTFPFYCWFSDFFLGRSAILPRPGKSASESVSADCPPQTD